MTTSAPQWPGQDGMNEGREAEGPQARPALVRELAASASRIARSGDGTSSTGGRPEPATTGRTPAGERPALRAVPDDARSRLQPATGPAAAPPAPERRRSPVRRTASEPSAPPQPLAPPEPSAAPEPLAASGRRVAGRRNRFVVVRGPSDRDLGVARRRARAKLPSPVAITRDIAMALLEVEAGCRSAAQLERIFSPELWEVLEHRISRRGGPLPSGRSLITVHCQEDRPGLADTVAVVQKGDLVRPVAIRLDAAGGRWMVTELRWWRNETDTATTPDRDGGPPC
jgi:hypothetical protein